MRSSMRDGTTRYDQQYDVQGTCMRGSNGRKSSMQEKDSAPRDNVYNAEHRSNAGVAKASFEYVREVPRMNTANVRRTQSNIRRRRRRLQHTPRADTTKLSPAPSIHPSVLLWWSFINKVPFKVVLFAVIVSFASPSKTTPEPPSTHPIHARPSSASHSPLPSKAANKAGSYQTAIFDSLSTLRPSLFLTKIRSLYDEAKADASFTATDSSTMSQVDRRAHLFQKNHSSDDVAIAGAGAADKKTLKNGVDKAVLQPQLSRGVAAINAKEQHSSITSNTIGNKKVNVGHRNVVQSSSMERGVGVRKGDTVAIDPSTTAALRNVVKGAPKFKTTNISKKEVNIEETNSVSSSLGSDVDRIEYSYDSDSEDWYSDTDGGDRDGGIASWTAKEEQEERRQQQLQVDSTHITPANISTLDDKSIHDTIFFGNGTATTSSSQQDNRNETGISVMEEDLFMSSVDFFSSGLLEYLDKVSFPFGRRGRHQQQYPVFQLSKPLRPLRKAASRATGMTGYFSGKPRPPPINRNLEKKNTQNKALDDEAMGLIKRRLAAIERAKAAVSIAASAAADKNRQHMLAFISLGRRSSSKRSHFHWLRTRLVRPAAAAIGLSKNDAEANTAPQYAPVGFRERMDVNDYMTKETRKLLAAVNAAEAESRVASAAAASRKEKRNREKVKDIDRQIRLGRELLMQLQSEKDDLQRRPNPLYNFTSQEASNSADEEQHTRGRFTFPPDDLVDEYINYVTSHHRLIMLNHTYLWQIGLTDDDDDDDDAVGDDILTPSADAEKLYRKERYDQEGNLFPRKSRIGTANGGGGSWLLRHSFGKGGSWGERIGEVVEISAYKAVCRSVMAVLSRSIAALHGISVMHHSDVRLFIESAPDLPPVGHFHDSTDYARQAMVNAMRQRSASRKRKKIKTNERERIDGDFIQRDAIVETLLSHCQISAPLLKLFPLSWQRAFLANIVDLVTGITSDFASGISLQVLGHRLAFSFDPLTESDILEQLESNAASPPFNHRRSRPEEFEAAVSATANDISEELSFLDRWHERALGSGMLRAQIANLIARIVLTLVDDILSGAQLNLWTRQSGGPRILAGLEYRTDPVFFGQPYSP